MAHELNIGFASFNRIKQVAAVLGIEPSGNRSRRDSWLKAIRAHQDVVAEKQFGPVGIVIRGDNYELTVPSTVKLASENGFIAFIL